MIFFDEVQKCPEVITWIKFLVDEGSCKYALSGSLLGVELKGVESVPVGYMSVKEVFPLDIEEFSRCLGLSDEVLTSVGEAFEKKIPVDEVVHAALMKMIHLYLVVGGMPAAVQAYAYICRYICLCSYRNPLPQQIRYSNLICIIFKI